MASIWDTPSLQTPTAPTQPAQQGNYWYQPNNGYGQTQDWYSTPVSQNIREQNTPLAFASWGAKNGIVNNDNTFNKWFNSQLSRFQQGYGLATMDNPMMNIDQYMATLPGIEQLKNEFNSLSPQARGSQYGVYSPNTRWINR